METKKKNRGHMKINCNSSPLKTFFFKLSKRIHKYSGFVFVFSEENKVMKNELEFTNLLPSHRFHCNKNDHFCYSHC